MRSTKWAAVVMAVIAFGVAGCGAGDVGTDAAAAPASPRPEGTGPLTKEVVRTDLDTSAADAGVPANAPDFGGMNEDAEAGSPRSCGLGFKGFATKATEVDVARWESVVAELRERDWQDAQVTHLPGVCFTRRNGASRCPCGPKGPERCGEWPQPRQ